MGFQEVQSLDCEVTTALGGFNKKTGKANPTKIEGYYLGVKEVSSPKSKTGKSTIYIFQTAKGNVGVWGKTDLDRKMSGATLGCMTRVTQSGKVATPNGEMYKFKVEVDKENVTDLELAQTSSLESASEDESQAYDSEEVETSLEDDSTEDSFDEVPAQRPQTPKQAAQSPSAASQARVKALLAARTNKSAS